MNTMQQWFDAYGASHQNATNKAIHWICVPLIFFTIIGILSLIPFGFVQQYLADAWWPYVHVGTLLLIFGIVFFIRLSLPVAVGMVLVSMAMLWLVHRTHLLLGEQAGLFFIIVFVLAWIGQFIGHKIEGAKPSFFDDLKFLMIGPAWLLHFIYRKLGISY